LYNIIDNLLSYDRTIIKIIMKAEKVMFKGVGRSIKSIFVRRTKKVRTHRSINDHASGPLASRLYRLNANAELTKEQVDAVLALKKMKEAGTLSTVACRARVYKIISALSVEKAIEVLNEI